MRPMEERIAELKEKMEADTDSQFVSRVAKSADTNPTAAAFNIWHANGDIGVGSDKPWGEKI